MKVLFTGGVKSGKSLQAENFILQQTSEKPYYLTTAEAIDNEMRQRITNHRERRSDRFVTIEEPVRLFAAAQEYRGPVLIESVSIWLNNMMYYQKTDEQIWQELVAVLALPLDIVFVQNEVGSGVISGNPLVRSFADLSGRIAQLLGECCDQVFFCCASQSLRLK